jgi:hypothetical protein
MNGWFDEKTGEEDLSQLLSQKGKREISKNKTKIS